MGTRIYVDGTKAESYALIADVIAGLSAMEISAVVLCSRCRIAPLISEIRKV